MHRDGVQKNVTGRALVKGFKDLTIPHPLSLSFISNNQAWPQNIPLDGKKTCCLSASHSSLDCQSRVFLLKSSVTFTASNTKHSLFLADCHVFKARYLFCTTLAWDEGQCVWCKGSPAKAGPQTLWTCLLPYTKGHRDKRTTFSSGEVSCGSPKVFLHFHRQVKTKAVLKMAVYLICITQT